MILNHVKLAIIFMKYVTSVVAINFVTKNFHLKQNGVTCIKFTESSRAFFFFFFFNNILHKERKTN